MKSFEKLVHGTIDPLRKYTWPIRIALVLFFVLAIYLINSNLNSSGNSQTAFLTALDLRITFVVKKINRTGNHGYGVVYGTILETNKSRPYAASYKNEYVICKMQDKRVLLVTRDYLMLEGDTISLNTKPGDYTVRRARTPVATDVFTMTTDFFL